MLRPCCYAFVLCCAVLRARLTNRTRSMLNLGSYNYLGFADDWGATCRDGVLPVLDTLPVACSINRKDYGEREKARIIRGTAVFLSGVLLLWSAGGARKMCRQVSVVVSAGRQETVMIL